MAGTAHHLTTGRHGEDAALATYLARGYRLVARNWRCPIGELDLVLARGGVVVFCAVKARSGGGLGGPFEAVNRRKQRKLRALAEAFLAGSDPMPGDVRFDVASVLVDRSGHPSVEVFEHAF